MFNEDVKSSEFFSLYNGVQWKLYSFLMMMLHNREAVEDVLQDVSTTMWEKFDQFSAGSNFTAWAIAIARNKAFEYLRANRKMRMVFQENQYLDLSDVAASSVSDFHQHLDALDVCLKKLKNKEQTLLAMRYRQNTPVKQISQGLGCSTRLVYKKLASIFGILRICIQNSLDGEEIVNL